MFILSCSWFKQLMYFNNKQFLAVLCLTDNCVLGFFKGYLPYIIISLDESQDRGFVVLLLVLVVWNVK